MEKQSTHKYWFKRRRYGYGWTPSSWQGWTVLVVFLAIIFLGTLLLKDTPRNTFSPGLAMYLIVVFIAVVALIITAYKKGPAPRWRWGKTDKDNSEEDF